MSESQKIVNKGRKKRAGKLFHNLHSTELHFSEGKIPPLPHREEPILHPDPILNAELHFHIKKFEDR